MIVNYVSILVMTFISSFASFFLKKSTTGETILGIAKNKFLYIGGFLYIIAALLNVWILQKMPYSVVLPLGSICYIWTMFIAIIFLKEKIVKGKIIGLSLIITGVIFLAI